MIESRQRLGLALSGSILIEAAVPIGAIHLAEKPPAVPRPPMQISLIAPPPPVPVPPAPKPVPTPQPPVPVPAKPQPQPPKPQPVHHFVRPAPKLAPPPPISPPTDAPVLPAPKPAPPPPPAPASTATPTEIDNFIAAMNAAVQAAVRYPNAARVLHRTGTTILSFDDRDGVVSNPQVLTSSGSDLLDRAALAALADASFPPMPDKLRGETQHMTINVLFTEE